jgi:cobalt-zinc-cadmium efflux system protein
VFKLFEDTKVEPLYMITVGSIAFVANIVSAYILNSINVSSCSAHHHHDHHDHHHGEDINIKSAYFHMLSDALISIGVVVAGVFIFYFDVFFIDSLLAIVFCIYIVFHSYNLLKKSFFALMDFNTTDITKQTLDDIILCDKAVLQYHDLHISSPSHDKNYVSFHIVLNDPNIALGVCEDINNVIKKKLALIGFSHVVIQVDTQNCQSDDITCCV